MRLTHVRTTDLNLLLALAILVEERSVTRAAERFNLSQPAMSRLLQRLRETFGDELLVRTKAGYEPTLRARHILSELEDMLPRLDAMIRGSEFDPATATDHFTIACTDYATVVLGPRLSARTFNAAPNISIDLIGWHDGAFDDCIAGRTDAVLWVNAVPDPLVSEVLFEEEFVCVISADHDLADIGITLEDYLRYPHVIVSVLAGQQTLIEDRLTALGVPRVVGLRVPYFAAAVNMVPGTNLIATVPSRVAQLYATSGSIRVITPPLELEQFKYVLGWHPRSSNDPAHVWLRHTLQAAAHSA